MSPARMVGPSLRMDMDVKTASGWKDTVGLGP